MKHGFVRCRSFLFLVVNLIFLLTACDSSPPPATGSTAKQDAVKKVLIGSVAPMSGPQAHLGQDNSNGALLAIEDLNAQALVIGGQKIEFVLLTEDDQADPRTATIVAQKLVDEGAAGVVGHLNSGTSIPASKIYYDAGLPQVSPSATAVAYTAQGFSTAYRVMANDAQQGKVLGEFAVQKLKAISIAVIDDRSAYGQGLADEFEKVVKAAGGTLVAREFTTDKNTDFMAILTTIKGKNADLVFYAGMDAQAGPLMKQLRNLGSKAKFLGADGMQNTGFLKLAGADAEGAMASSPGMPYEVMPKGAAFRERFIARFGEIQGYAVFSYDAVNVLATAMQRADSVDPKIYAPKMRDTDLAGVSGQIRFDEKGDRLNSSVTLYEVKQGAWVALETMGGTGH